MMIARVTLTLLQAETTTIFGGLLPSGASFIVGVGRVLVSFTGPTVILNGEGFEFQFFVVLLSHGTKLNAQMMTILVKIIQTQGEPLASDVRRQILDGSTALWWLFVNFLV